MSMVPWASFEAFHLNLQKGYDYLPPIFTMGRFHEEGGKVLLPLAVQVHHAVCDGFHLVPAGERGAGAAARGRRQAKRASRAEKPASRMVSRIGGHSLSDSGPRQMIHMENR